MPDSLPNRLADATILRATQTERYAVGLMHRLLILLQELEETLIGRLQHRAMDPTAPIRTYVQRRRLEALLMETQGLIASQYREMTRETRQELIGLAEQEQLATVHMVNRELGATLMRSGLTPQRLRLLVDDTFLSGGASQAATIKQWWERQAASMQQRFAHTLRAGLLQDETVGQLVRRVRGTKAARYQDGAFQLSRREAETLVRTAVMGVQNTVREETLRQNPAVIRGVMLIVTLDARTSSICISRSGSAWNLADGKPLDWSTRKEPYPGPPPYHMRCRSILAPVTRDYTDMLRQLGGPRTKAALQQLSAEERQALITRTPRQEDYGGWLRRQSPAVQTTVLGAQRRALWLKGDLNLHDLIDQRGRPLTLAELKERA